MEWSLYSGSLSSQLLPTSVFHSHSGVGCHEVSGSKKKIVSTMSLFPYLVTNLHQLQVPGNKLGCTKGTVLSGHQGYSIPLLVHALKEQTPCAERVHFHSILGIGDSSLLM